MDITRVESIAAARRAVTEQLGSVDDVVKNAAVPLGENDDALSIPADERVHADSRRHLPLGRSAGERRRSRMGPHRHERPSDEIASAAPAAQSAIDLPPPRD